MIQKYKIVDARHIGEPNPPPIPAETKRLLVKWHAMFMSDAVNEQMDRMLKKPEQKKTLFAWFLDRLFR